MPPMKGRALFLLVPQLQKQSWRNGMHGTRSFVGRTAYAERQAPTQSTVVQMHKNTSDVLGEESLDISMRFRPASTAVEGPRRPC